MRVNNIRSCLRPGFIKYSTTCLVSIMSCMLFSWIDVISKCTDPLQCHAGRCNFHTYYISMKNQHLWCYSYPLPWHFRWLSCLKIDSACGIVLLVTCKIMVFMDTIVWCQSEITSPISVRRIQLLNNDNLSKIAIGTFLCSKYCEWLPYPWNKDYAPFNKFEFSISNGWLQFLFVFSCWF